MEPIKDNQVLYVDLATKKISKEEILPDLRKNYIGGAGINTKIFFDSEAMYHDALSDKNILIFGVGPTVGTGLLAGNRCTITAKSPVTDMYGDSNIGGDFTLRMRSAGFDHIVFTGKADKPVYLYINKEQEIHILDATDLWGTWTDKVTTTLLERHGKNCEIACIGPAGEQLIRYASVIMSKCHAAGRMGMGCVMGSKNLKAIVIDSDRKFTPAIYNQDSINHIKKVWMDNCRSSVVSKMGSIEGTLFLIEKYDKAKHIPIRNCQAAYDEKTKNIYSTEFKYEYQTKRKACYACPVGCAKEYEIKEGKFRGEKGDRIDYGTVAGVGANVGVFDWASILHLKMLCDYLGMDTIEAGGSIGLIIECQQRGIISSEDTDGKTLEFGNVEDIEYLMHKAVSREGIGDLIAEGAYRAAKKLNAEEYAFCINKSTTGLQSNARLAWSLGYLTSTRGGDHLKNFPFTSLFGGYFSEIVAKYIFRMNAGKTIGMPEDKGRVVWWHENYKYIVDSLGICIFAIHGLPNTGNAFFQDFANIMNALFGIDMTDEDVLYAGERIYQLQNAFNVNSGQDIHSYKWPIRKKEKDIDDLLIEETTIKVRDEPGMLPEYFKFRGLTDDGKPTASRFEELGISQYISKAKAASTEGIVSIKDLLKVVGLNAKLTAKDRTTSFFISLLLRRLLELKDKSDRKKYLQQKGSIQKNI
jgi:aldehyde:ferredoxin oxidoreductase